LRHRPGDATGGSALMAGLSGGLHNRKRMRLLCRPGVVGVVSGREEPALCGDRPDALDELTDLVDHIPSEDHKAYRD